MSAVNWSFEEAESILESWGEIDANNCVEIAYSASINAGYRAGAAAGNPLSFLRDFFLTEIAPRLESNKKFVCATIVETKAKMQQEGFAGPVSQTIYIHAIVADAIYKVMTSQTTLALSNLTTMDWLAIGVCFMMWARTDETESMKSLIADIQNAIQDE